jgi:hypothetical protein
VSLANGRRLAVLSVTDHSYLPTGSAYYDDSLQPGENFSTSSYRQAVSAELHKLKQVEGGPPDVVVCIVNGFGLQRDGTDFKQSIGSRDDDAGIGDGNSAKEAVLQFAREMIGVDIFIVAGVRGLTTLSQYADNSLFARGGHLLLLCDDFVGNYVNTWNVSKKYCFLGTWKIGLVS